MMRCVVGIILLLMLLQSCKSSKKLQAVITDKDSLVTIIYNPIGSDSIALVNKAFEKLNDNKIQFETFSSKVKVDYKDSKKRSYDLNAHIRIKKDSTIWVSVIATLGIEAFRVCITPDSVKILNKLDKEVQYRTVEYIRDIIQLPVDFYTLQDIIVGNSIFVDSTQVRSYQESENHIWLTNAGEFFKQLLKINKSDYSVAQSKMDDIDVNRNRTAEFIFDNYALQTNRLFASSRGIVVAEKNRIEIMLDFKQPAFDTDLNFPFNIPRGYTVK